MFGDALAVPISAAAAPQGDLAQGRSGAPQFVRNQVTAITLTREWYQAGFEQAPRIADDRWQLKARQSRCEAASSAVTIDGKLDDAAWAGASPAVTLQFLWDSQTGAKQKTQAPVVWGAQAFYVGFDAADVHIIRALRAARGSDVSGRRGGNLHQS
jgi:hypothetical protein